MTLNIQYVQVPVPSHLVPEVMHLITEDPQFSKTSTQGWSEAEIGKLWSESAQNMRRTLALLAANSPNSVTGERIARDVLGKEQKGHSVAGMMGAFTRRMKGRHKGRNPVRAEYDAEAHVWTYSIRPEVGQVILSIEHSRP